MEPGSFRDEQTPIRLSARIGLKNSLAAPQAEAGGSAPTGAPTSGHALFARTSARRNRMARSRYGNERRRRNYMTVSRAELAPQAHLGMPVRSGLVTERVRPS
jgi:hypothetical protein